MRTIPLTQGKVTLVDDEDYDELNRYKWYAHNTFKNWYALRSDYINIKQKTIRMHHQVTGFRYKMIDHIDRNGLNNQKCNLRPCNHSQNRKNARLHKNNKSGLRGVFWNEQRKKWETSICKDGKAIYLGLFDDKIEAAHIVDKKAKELFGEFAILNFPEKVMMTG